MVAPLSALVIITLILALNVATYQSQHRDRIYTGVSLLGVDLSQMTEAEAKAALHDALAYAQADVITFTDPATNQTWSKSAAELGAALDVDGMVTEAYNVGRQGGPFRQFREMFTAWYFGQTLAPTIVLDEGQLEQSLASLAAEIDRPAVDAAFTYENGAAAYVPSQAGRRLDVAAVRENLLAPLTEFRPVQVSLPIVETRPQVNDAGETAVEIQQAIYNPINFYLPE
ncbi:MAG: peptidoglycan binding domain-containing protein, partial [Anaerolineales bacterium]|nr:peptidoglycan binding domain-containing protein [Anaerolineales bacterium]